VRRLDKIDLWEISVVTFPMLPDARVSAAKRGQAAHLDVNAGHARLAGKLRHAARAISSR
jgi:Escherichia/Staphylococcus phage prohead protease